MHALNQGSLLLLPSQLLESRYQDPAAHRERAKHHTATGAHTCSRSSLGLCEGNPNHLQHLLTLHVLSKDFRLHVGTRSWQQAQVLEELGLHFPCPLVPSCIILLEAPKCLQTFSLASQSKLPGAGRGVSCPWAEVRLTGGWPAQTKAFCPPTVRGLRLGRLRSCAPRRKQDVIGRPARLCGQHAPFPVPGALQQLFLALDTWVFCSRRMSGLESLSGNPTCGCCKQPHAAVAQAGSRHPPLSAV